MNDESGKKPNRAKGALVVAAKMTPEQKAERARKGAIARWGVKPPLATHKGNFKDDFGFDVECYVLNDDARTAVISQRGMGTALGLGEGGSRLPAFLQGEKIAPYVGHELRAKLENPLIFQGSTAGTNSVSAVTKAHGYDATVLIEICRAIVAARDAGVLLKRQARIADRAQIIINASANAGIKGLVYALAGYRPEVDEVIQAFKAFVQEEARKYEQEFPNELYLQWHRLYKIPVPVRGKPWLMRKLTVEHIYYPLAKSNGKILELLRALKAQDGEQKKKLFQFLNEIGARALRMHIGRVLEMTESSTTAAEYDSKIVARFGGQQELPLFQPHEPNSIDASAT